MPSAMKPLCISSPETFGPTTSTRLNWMPGKALASSLYAERATMLSSMSMRASMYPKAAARPSSSFLMR